MMDYIWMSRIVTKRPLLNLLRASADNRADSIVFHEILWKIFQFHTVSTWLLDVWMCVRECFAKWNVYEWHFPPTSWCIYMHVWSDNHLFLRLNIDASMKRVAITKLVSVLARMTHLAAWSKTRRAFAFPSGRNVNAASNIFVTLLPPHTLTSKQRLNPQPPPPPSKRN